MRLFALAALAGQALGHTWIEQMSVIKDGMYTGDYGYPRGYVARTDPGFSGQSNVYILPPASAGRSRIADPDLLCHESQRTAKNTDNYPRLTAAPGSWMAMRYTENGHVTLPETTVGKPENGGTVYVFATTEPKEDEKLTEVLKWTADGSGGDKRGRLLTAQDYDDGRCYQINPSANSKSRQEAFAKAYPDQPIANAEQWCETDVNLPKDLETGKTLTVYWVWSWPTMPGIDPNLPDGKDEYYTNCADIEIAAALPEVQAKNAHSLVQQDPQTAAVPGYESRTAVNPELAATGAPAPGPIDAPASSQPAPAPTAAPTTSSTPAFTPQPSMTTIVVTLVETFTVPIPQVTQNPGSEAAQSSVGATTTVVATATWGGSAKFRHR